MNVQHLHDLRDGQTIRRKRKFNPFVHISIDTPLMQMLFNITRPPVDESAPVKRGIVLATRKKFASTTPTAGGSMVAYKKERKKF